MCSVSPVIKPPLNKDTQLVSIARYQTSHTGRDAPPRILCSASLLAEHPKHQNVPKVLLKATRDAPRAFRRAPAAMSLGATRQSYGPFVTVVRVDTVPACRKMCVVSWRR